MKAERKLSVFENISLDGFFTDNNGKMDWAYTGAGDPEWQEFTRKNAESGGDLLFGRKTYEMMAGWWPTDAALLQMPEVANGINASKKYVVTKTITRPEWQNTTVLNGDLVEQVRSLKSDPGPDLIILGSGSIVSQLAAAGLIDQLQLIVNPVVLGRGRTLFGSVADLIHYELTDSRIFNNGKVALRYGKA